MFRSKAPGLGLFHYRQCFLIILSSFLVEAFVCDLFGWQGRWVPWRVVALVPTEEGWKQALRVLKKGGYCASGESQGS